MVQGFVPDSPLAPGAASAALDAFGTLVLGDTAIQAALGAIAVPAAFVAAAVALAATHGIALHPAAVEAAIRPDPLGIGRFGPAPVTCDRWPGPGWLPARSVPTGETPAFDWAWFGDDALRAPFYEDSVRRHAARPFSQMFRTRTTMAALLAGAEAAAPLASAEAAAPVAPPAGFIYHMSRCGSTLVAQMLGADPTHRVLSEPEPLDAVLRWATESGASPALQVAAVRAVVAALGHDGTGTVRRVFVKLDSWHTAALPLLRAAFPDTRWVFLYRDPVEVLVSQLRQRGSHTVPGMLSPAVLGVTGIGTNVEAMADERYVALVLARIGKAVLEHWPVGGGIVVDHADLPGAVIDRIAPHFGLSPDDAARAAMVATGTRDAKAPERRFVPDAADKRLEASAAVRAAAQELLVPLYARIAALRRY